MVSINAGQFELVFDCSRVVLAINLSKKFPNEWELWLLIFGISLDRWENFQLNEKPDGSHSSRFLDEIFRLVYYFDLFDLFATSGKIQFTIS